MASLRFEVPVVACPTWMLASRNPCQKPLTDYHRNQDSPDQIRVPTNTADRGMSQPRYIQRLCTRTCLSTHCNLRSFDVAQGRFNKAPNKTRTHSCRFASVSTHYMSESDYIANISSHMNIPTLVFVGKRYMFESHGLLSAHTST